MAYLQVLQTFPPGLQVT